MKREAELKAAFGREMRRQLPHFIMLQYMTAGAPDREIIGNGWSSRWEMKHCTPGFDSPGNQELTCMRIAAQNCHCRYVLWTEDRFGNKKTIIMHPRHVHDKTYLPESWCDGYDMAWLVNEVKRVHGVTSETHQSGTRAAERTTTATQRESTEREPERT